MAAISHLGGSYGTTHKSPPMVAIPCQNFVISV